MKIILNIIMGVYLLIIACAIAYALYKSWDYQGLTTKVILSVSISWVIVLGVRAIIHDHKMINKPK